MTSIIRGPLSQHQQTQLAAVGPSVDLNDHHFDHACRLGEIEAELDGELDPRIATNLRLEAKRLDHKLTPAVKSAAADTHRKIVRAALTEIRTRGKIENISNFTRSLNASGALTRTYGRAAKPKPIGDKAVRAVLKRYLGIVERPGRRRP